MSSAKVAVKDRTVDAQEGTVFKLTKKANNGILYTIFWHASMRVARWFAPLKISPNLVSCSSFVLWFAAGVAFYQGTYAHNVIGALLYLLGVFMDTVDGKLARITDRCSHLGVWLDYNFDSLRYLFLYPPMAIAIFDATGLFYPLAVAMVAVAIALVTDVLNLQFRQFPFAREVNEEYTKRSPLHRVFKQFYWTEGIETVVVLAAATLDLLLWYLLAWTAVLLLKYLAVATIWGSRIAAADRARRASPKEAPEHEHS